MKFLIKKNTHYSNGFLFKLLNFFNFKSKICYDLRFDKSTMYNLENLNQLDINKLVGFSSGFHHKNSARIGWNCDSKNIILHTYCYINGKRTWSELARIKTENLYRISIEDSGIYYEFKIIDDVGRVTQKSVEKPITYRFGYNLWPFFGGDEPAPHDMYIELKKV